MKKALLIYNPSSGSRREQRVQQVKKALAIFRNAGVDAESCPTTNKGSAIAQARNAVADGFDTVIACGGDGTANEILNGLMLAQGDVALGVLPFGSGNLLATDLRLPSRAEAAAEALLRYKPHALQPGLMRYQSRTGSTERYFIIAAGVGADAELMYRTAVQAKERYGINAYFLEMFRMALRRQLPLFNVEWQDGKGNGWNAEVTMVMAVRGHRFPGLLKRVRLDVELTRNHYLLMLFRTAKVRHFLNYFASVMTGLNWKVPQIELAHSTWFRCTPLSTPEPNRIHSEVDGEHLGTLPVEVSIEPRTFKLLMPPSNLTTE